MSHASTEHAPDNTLAPLVDRINVEPPILLGLSSSEALITIGIAFLGWAPIVVLLSVAVGGVVLFVFLETLLPMATVWIAAKQMAVIKRSRPDLYYVHAARAWAARWGLRRLRTLTHAGPWELGRQFPVQHRRGDES